MYAIPRVPLDMRVYDGDHPSAVGSEVALHLLWGREGGLVPLIVIYTTRETKVLVYKEKYQQHDYISSRTENTFMHSNTQVMKQTNSHIHANDPTHIRISTPPSQSSLSHREVPLPVRVLDVQPQHVHGEVQRLEPGLHSRYIALITIYVYIHICKVSTYIRGLYEYKYNRGSMWILAVGI